VTAKMRLGYEDTSLTLDNAIALAAAGASELTVHARTKTDGYRPPAYWPWIKKIRQVVSIPVIANGEIWQPADAALCREQSGSSDIMLGRGALAQPNLAARIAGGDGGQEIEALPWPAVLELLMRYSEFEIAGDKGLYYSNRIKQWFSYLKLQYPEAELLFARLRLLRRSPDILALLHSELALR
jgi:tRNA-dihydrouridine synthase C